MATCGAKTRAGTSCLQPAGWGTDHPGRGRCRLHGGCSLRGHLHPRYKSGRYALYEIVVHANEARGIVDVNDAKVLVDANGRCRGIVQVGDGPSLDPPVRLRPQDIDVFRGMPGYVVSTEDGLGAYMQELRRLRGARAARSM